jgi:carotenoid 1,2-hydratase
MTALTMPRVHSVELPTASGAYRWYYVDVSNGEYTFVAIFMLGGLFSPRYAKASKRGAAPTEYSAVNCAVYRHGQRVAWVLSEYAQAQVDASCSALTIGRSVFRYRPGGCDIVIDDQTTPFLMTSLGEAFQARASVEFEGPSGDEVKLFEGQPHFWQARAPFAKASVEVSTLSLAFAGRAYHDLNHGAELLGTRVPGWEWQRTHSPLKTEVVYRPHGESNDIRVVAHADSVNVSREPQQAFEQRHTGWRLKVPKAFVEPEASAMLESSPFYARLEVNAGEQLALAEVANFRRFHQPSVQWMASCKTRVGGRS